MSLAYSFGTDEAGKGAVLGAMFAAAVAVADLDAIPTEVDDSKKLTPTRRGELHQTLVNDPRISIGVASIPSGRIDGHESMERLTAAAHAEAIDAVLKNIDGAANGHLDAAGHNPRKFAAEVVEKAASDIEVEATHGADETEPIVGAASIVAKVRRDRHVQELAEKHSTELGSGYPGDEKTIAFLREYVERTGKLPPAARETWDTSREILGNASQTGLDDF